MGYTIETKEYKGYRINIVVDEDCEAGHAFGDEPMILLRGGSYGRTDEVHSNEWRHTTEWNVLNAILCDYDSQFYIDEFGYEAKQTAKRFSICNYGKWHHFKTDKARRDWILRNEGLEHVRVEAINSVNRDYYLFAWDQKQLDEYAGCKGAKPMLETATAWLNGECYGWQLVELDEEGEELDTLDSCWGYIGDTDYVLGEARDAADHFASERDEEQAREQEASRLDMYSEALT